jgi:hypothetical protein
LVQASGDVLFVRARAVQVTHSVPDDLGSGVVRHGVP